MSKKRTLSGFTLVEVTTSLLIMSILVSIASTAMIVGVNIFARNAIMKSAQTDGNNVYDFLYERISYAAALRVNSDQNINNKNNEYDYYEKIIIDGNSIYVVRGNGDGINKEETNSTRFYIYGNEEQSRVHGNTCEVVFDSYNSSSDSIRFSVTISRDEEIYYQKSGEIPLYNRPFVYGFNSTDDNSFEVQRIEYYYYDNYQLK